MPLSEAASITAVTVLIFVNLVHILSLIRRDTSIMDIAWGIGFVLISGALWQSLDQLGLYFRLVAVVTITWGIRLATHILTRKAGKPEDWRYANWREQWGRNYWWRSYLQVFVLQGLLMFVIAMPLYISASHPAGGNLELLAYVGLLVWAIGYFFESVGDWQLSQFLRRQAERSKHSSKRKDKNKSAIMQTGLWRYTRHPNYFGEITQWWGVFIIVAPLENGLWAIVSPLTISFLLLRVSGITMLEKRFEGNKEFAAYKRRTSALIPMPPKK